MFLLVILMLIYLMLIFINIKNSRCNLRLCFFFYAKKALKGRYFIDEEIDDKIRGFGIFCNQLVLKPEVLKNKFFCRWIDRSVFKDVNQNIRFDFNYDDGVPLHNSFGSLKAWFQENGEICEHNFCRVTEPGWDEIKLQLKLQYILIDLEFIKNNSDQHIKIQMSKYGDENILYNCVTHNVKLQDFIDLVSAIIFFRDNHEVGIIRFEGLRGGIEVYHCYKIQDFLPNILMGRKLCLSYLSNDFVVEGELDYKNLKSFCQEKMALDVARIDLIKKFGENLANVIVLHNRDFWGEYNLKALSYVVSKESGRDYRNIGPNYKSKKYLADISLFREKAGLTRLSWVDMKFGHSRHVHKYMDAIEKSPVTIEKVLQLKSYQQIKNDSEIDIVRANNLKNIIKSERSVISSKPKNDESIKSLREDLVKKQNDLNDIQKSISSAKNMIKFKENLYKNKERGMEILDFPIKPKVVENYNIFQKEVNTAKMSSTNTYLSAFLKKSEKRQYTGTKQSKDEIIQHLNNCITFINKQTQTVEKQISSFIKENALSQIKQEPVKTEDKISHDEWITIRDRASKNKFAKELNEIILKNTYECLYNEENQELVNDFELNKVMLNCKKHKSKTRIYKSFYYASKTIIEKLKNNSINIKFKDNKIHDMTLLLPNLNIGEDFDPKYKIAKVPKIMKRRKPTRSEKKKSKLLAKQKEKLEASSMEHILKKSKNKRVGVELPTPVLSKKLKHTSRRTRVDLKKLKILLFKNFMIKVSLNIAKKAESRERVRRYYAFWEEHERNKQIRAEAAKAAKD